ncbi:MAG TPA: hypothetical protein VN673_09400 [Clostridia bacterium]|nr:hypothetical protein [Clostridia bacterium]
MLTKEAHGIRCALGFQFAESASSLIQSFVNSSPTRLGGTHLDGFLLGLTEALNKDSSQRRPFKPHELRTGLFAVVGVWLSAPQYGGATKDELINTEVETFVRELALEGVGHWLADPERNAEWVVQFLDEQRRRVEGAD